MTLKKSTAALAVLAAMVTGCGGEDAKSADRKDERSSASAAPTPNATDAAIAQASLLTLSDFPAGWEAKAPDQDDDDEDAQRRLADCVGVPFEDLDQRGHRSKAESKDFVSEDDDEISNSVAVITEQTRTTRAFAIVSSVIETLWASKQPPPTSPTSVSNVPMPWPFIQAISFSTSPITSGPMPSPGRRSSL